MKVILKENREHLGFKDEVIDVKNGFARNYLIPKGIASLATPSAIKMLEENLRQSAVKNKKIQDEAQKTADALSDMVVKVKVKAGEKGKIFGSVTTAQLADAIEKSGHKIDKKYIKINGGAIKNVGSFEAIARLHKDVAAVVKFDVIADGAGKKSAKPKAKAAKAAPAVEEKTEE
jgi:large subunit ribosomal protein L9